MRAKLGLIVVLALGLSLTAGPSAFGRPFPPKDHKEQAKKGTSPGNEIGGGGKDIGKGAGKGAESMGKGTAGAAGDLVTGHPVDAGASLGKGAGGLGKDVGVGTAKGAAKIGKGVGGEFKKLEKKASGGGHHKT